MTAEVLVVVRRLTRRIAHKSWRLQRLRNMLTSTSKDLDGMPHAQAQSPIIERLTVSIVDLEEVVRVLKKIRADSKIELEDLLYRLIGNHEREFETLAAYYCDNFSFSAISSMFSFSISTVYRLHKQGLKMLGLNVEEVQSAEDATL